MRLRSRPIYYERTIRGIEHRHPELRRRRYDDRKYHTRICNVRCGSRHQNRNILKGIYQPQIGNRRCIVTVGGTARRYIRHCSGFESADYADGGIGYDSGGIVPRWQYLKLYLFAVER